MCLWHCGPRSCLQDAATPPLCTTIPQVFPGACAFFWAGEVPPVLPWSHNSWPAKSSGSWAGAAVGQTLGSGTQEGAGCPLGQGTTQGSSPIWSHVVAKKNIKSSKPLTGGRELLSCFVWAGKLQHLAWKKPMGSAVVATWLLPPATGWLEQLTWQQWGLDWPLHA